MIGPTHLLVKGGAFLRLTGGVRWNIAGPCGPPSGPVRRALLGTELRPRGPLSPAGTSLPLLPSGPRGVHRYASQRARPSSPGAPRPIPSPRPLGRPIGSTYSGFWMQGTANPPPARADRTVYGRTSGSQHVAGAQGSVGSYRLTTPRLSFWRRGWDSNPRHPLGVHLLSRQVASAAHPPLRDWILTIGSGFGKAHENPSPA